MTKAEWLDALRSTAGYLAVGVAVTGAAAVLYEAYVISALAVYGFVFVVLAIIGVGFFRWEARNYRERHRGLR